MYTPRMAATMDASLLQAPLPAPTTPLANVAATNVANPLSDIRTSAITTSVPQLPANAVSPTTTDEYSRAAYVYELFRRARSARRTLVAQWKAAYRSLHNRSWMPASESWMPSPSVAQIFPVIFSSVAWMTDQRPIVQVQPSPQPFSQFADYYQSLANDMNTILSALWMNHSMDLEVNKILWDVFTYKIGYSKVVWEPWLADGLGDAVMRRVSPFNIYPDPHAKDWASCTYIIEAQQMTLSQLDRAFPGARNRMRGGATMEQVDEQPHVLEDAISASTPRVALGNLSTNPNTLYAMTNSPRDRAPALQDDPVFTVLHCWHRDHKVTDTDDPAVKKVTDGWQCTVVCGNTVLMDKPAGEVTAFNTHPYDKMVLTDVGEWYGPGLVDMLAPLQDSITRILTAIEQNIALMGNPMLVESPRAQSVSKRISNRPGQRVNAQPGEIAWLQPPQMHPQMSVMLMQFYKGEIESISGLSAMVRGFSPNGRNSEGVLDTVQDAAFVRVRATLRQLEAMLRGACDKLAASVAEFYTEDRNVSFLGNDGQQYNIALHKNHFYVRDAENPENRIPMRFQLQADAGSQLPTSKQARAAEAERMFALGIIDVLEVLKAKGWPNYSEVAKRTIEQQATGMLNPSPGRRRA